MNFDKAKLLSIIEDWKCQYGIDIPSKHSGHYRGINKDDRQEFFHSVIATAKSRGAEREYFHESTNKIIAEACYAPDECTHYNKKAARNRGISAICSQIRQAVSSVYGEKVIYVTKEEIDKHLSPIEEFDPSKHGELIGKIIPKEVLEQKSGSYDVIDPDMFKLLGYDNE